MCLHRSRNRGAIKGGCTPNILGGGPGPLMCLHYLQYNVNSICHVCPPIFCIFMCSHYLQYSTYTACSMYIVHSISHTSHEVLFPLQYIYSLLSCRFLGILFLVAWHPFKGFPLNYHTPFELLSTTFDFFILWLWDFFPFTIFLKP